MTLGEAIASRTLVGRGKIHYQYKSGVSETREERLTVSIHPHSKRLRHVHSQRLHHAHTIASA